MPAVGLLELTKYRRSLEEKSPPDDMAETEWEITET